MALACHAPVGGWTLDKLGELALGDAWHESSLWQDRREGGLTGNEWSYAQAAIEAGAPAPLVAELEERVTVSGLLTHIGIATAPAHVGDGDRMTLEGAGLLAPRLLAPSVDLQFRAAQQGALFGGPLDERGHKVGRCRTCGGTGRAVALEAGTKLATPRQAKLWRWTAGESRPVTVDCWKCRGSTPGRWWWPHDAEHPAHQEPRGRFAPWQRRSR
jgi:hypothetical protein